MKPAGIPLSKASGSKTSVYTGCFTDDYRVLTSKDENDLPTYAATGTAPSMLAARLSWFFNFTGPSLNLDSACSSSMTAFDLACQGLQSGTADMVWTFKSHKLVHILTNVSSPSWEAPA